VWLSLSESYGKVDVRVVAATNRDLAQLVAEGRFRGDLYYPLNVFPVVLPPLRERRDDIPRLVRHFTQRFARRMGRRIEAIPSAVMDALVRYSWPGNVRELQNVIERAVILSPGPALQCAETGHRAPAGVRAVILSPGPALMVPLGDLQPTQAQAQPPTAAALTLADAEREHILGALREAGWVLGGPNGAAARLGMKRSLLYWKMKKLGISRPA
jgi:formate hydrogenlyase transcriptional activator